jgi:hypothetical protein
MIANLKYHLKNDYAATIPSKITPLSERNAQRKMIEKQRYVECTFIKGLQLEGIVQKLRK